MSETDFARHRDFARLQLEMAKQFKAVSKIMSEEIASRGLTGVMLSMPIRCGIKPIEDEVLTPLGPVTPAELRRWGALEGAELMRAAAAYSPWWGSGFDGSFCRGLALHSMWMDMRGQRRSMMQSGAASGKRWHGVRRLKGRTPTQRFPRRRCGR